MGPVTLVAALALSARLGLAACGDGFLDLGEFCDPGPAPQATCCTATCTFALPGTVCRPMSGACDIAEVCSGLSAVCPPNVFVQAGVCREAAGPCDLPESCSGIGPACPIDSVQAAGVVCRASTAACDIAETCTGSSVDCPADTGEPDHDQDGVCDGLDVCPAVADQGQADADGDGVGDACDPCTNVGGGALVSVRLALAKLSAPPDDDRIRLKAGLVVPDTPTVDPVKKGLRLVLAGPLGVVFDAFIPPGSFDSSTRAGWRADGDGRWSYKNGGDQVPRQAGIKTILLRRSADPTRPLRIVVSGRGGDLRAAVGQPSLTMTVVLDAPLATTGQCGEATFTTTGDVSDCRLLNSGHRLECRQKS